MGRLNKHRLILTDIASGYFLPPLALHRFGLDWQLISHRLFMCCFIASLDNWISYCRTIFFKTNKPILI